MFGDWFSTAVFHLAPGRPVPERNSSRSQVTPTTFFPHNLPQLLIQSQTITRLYCRRYAIGQYVDQSGDVISHLNISSAGSEDGGLYACIAANALASVEHKARLNIYGTIDQTASRNFCIQELILFPSGSPYIRSIGPVRAIAGKDITIACPYSGYPITSVEWSKSGVQLPLDIRQKLNEGLLTITSVDTNDNGTYTCTVRRSGETASRDIVLTVSSK